MPEGDECGLEGPGHLSSGAGGPPLPARPSWATWKGRGSPASRRCLSPEQGRGATRSQASSPPRKPRTRTRKSAPGRRQPGTQTTRRTSEVRPGRCFSLPPLLRPSVCQSVHSRPRVPSGGAGAGVVPLRPSKSRPTSRPALTRPAGDVQLPPPLVLPPQGQPGSARSSVASQLGSSQSSSLPSRTRAGSSRRPRGMLGAEVFLVQWMRAARSVRPGPGIEPRFRAERP